MPLTKEEVLNKIKDPAVVLLNVLPEKDFEILHIKDSQNLSLGPNVRAFESAAVKKLNKQTFFITYGADKDSSLGLNAAKLLAGKGFKADNYPGGLKDWTQAGLPTNQTKNLEPIPAPAQLKGKTKKEPTPLKGRPIQPK